MVDKAIFYPWFGVEVNNPSRVTSKAGWAPLPGGYQMMGEVFDANAVAVDKTAWDWTMPEWVIRAYVDMKQGQCKDWDDRYAWIVWRRLWFVLGPGTTFRMSDGIVYRQMYWGAMKSGWLLTLSMNSAAQAFQHSLAWTRMGRPGKLPKVWAMGDDTLLTSFPWLGEYWRSLETTGCLVKKIERNREFAGFVLTGNGSAYQVTPLYPDKHRFVLKHCGEQEQEILLSFSLIYALSADRWFHEQAAHYADFSVGAPQILWAKGLTQLQLFENLPAWTDL